ncbi:MAG: hypothetical protein KatS3mg116_0366 [Elioraea sp.]|nr:MAG: hypothetical protein KatS3mg116_0366 [Elioraea sp.]
MHARSLRHRAGRPLSASQAGLELLHVPFMGAARAYTALVAGEREAMVMNGGPAGALRASATQEVFRTQGILPVGLPPEETRTLIAADRERIGAVVRSLDIRLEQDAATGRLVGGRVEASTPTAS